MASLERASSAPRFSFLAGLVPLLFGLACVFIANIPVSILGGLVPSPLLALVPVYFWCLVRPDLMTPAEASRYLRCGRRRIYDLVSAGRLPRLREGGRLLLRRADLDRLVEEV